MSLGALHHRRLFGTWHLGLGRTGLCCSEDSSEVYEFALPGAILECSRLARSLALLEVRLPLGADGLVCHRPLHSWQEPLSAPAVFARPAARRPRTQLLKSCVCGLQNLHPRLLFREMFYLLGAAVPNFDRNEGLLVDAQIRKSLGFWRQLIGL